MKVALVTPEFLSLVRRTSLAELAEYLPRTLLQQGVDARVFLPLTQDVESHGMTGLERLGQVNVRDGDGEASFSLHTTKLGDLPIYLFDHPQLFRARFPYGDSEGPYPDNWLRYALFSRAVLESLSLLDFQADVLHCLDWTTGLIPLFRELEFASAKPDHPAANASTVFGIQNLAMQGAFEREILPRIGIPHRYFHSVGGVEHAGKVNFLKAGAEFASLVVTQSPAHAEHIQQLGRGDGLEDTFKRRKKELLGIQNGIDYRAWDPANDPLIAQKFSKENADFSGKKKCKATLQQLLRLQNGPRTPLLAIIGRFDSDSGFDVLAEALTPMLERNLQLVLMGPGRPEIMERLRISEQTFEGRFRIIDRYHVPSAHTILAGADAILLPGHYHPSNALCAIAMRYGAVPIVYAKSGLEDTVKHDPEGKPLTGFLFAHYNQESLLEGIDAARGLYKKPADWKKLVRNVLEQDFSWQASAAEYVKAYRRISRRGKGKKT